ncbi:MAG: HAD family acid phosphatase [Lachnospiraceae bacterium]|nr:HAD family acid phosphatase [Lachnospiraceae bacterium]
MEENKIHKLSPLGKTWIFDLDGTIFKHNGYKLDGKDSMLDGAKEFLDNIDENDMIIFLTSRTANEKELTEDMLKENNIRYDNIIYNAPYGERIVVNDAKPSGLETALAINTIRDEFMKDEFVIDESL